MTLGKVGMYGGKFLPFPHLGHVFAMIKASTMVDELHVIVSHDTAYEKKLCEGSKVDHVNYTMRKRWWTQIAKDLQHVHIHEVYEEQTGNFSDWEKGRDGILNTIGKEVDVVFSSEHDYTPIFDKLYPKAKHVVIDSKRETYNISGTKIRTEGILKHWDMIPNIVKPYFAKKVVVVGTESSGKSSMVKNLATLFNTSYVEEHGRTFYEELGGCEGITIREDYAEIAFEHKHHEKNALKKANKVLFIDTEAIVTQYFSMVYLGETQDVLEEIVKLQKYDMWLFLEPDVRWVDDGTRSFGDQEVRDRNNELLKSMLKANGVEYVTVSGGYQERLDTAVDSVNSLLEY